jgi:DNA-binding GntR family transcriptional regulator
LPHSGGCRLAGPRSIKLTRIDGSARCDAAKLAQRLNAKARSPALWLCRRYLNRRGQLVELTISVHPADRYSYSETFQLDWHAN